ncbi:MAG: protein arginine kinase [Clostridia bacterium]|nr:protein arginine kinase [Clostridia bacterium]
MSEWFNDTGMQNDIVISTRVRLARNLKGIPFPHKAGEENCRKVVALVEEALSALNYKFTKVDLSQLTQTQRQALVEERYISLNMAECKRPGAVFISEDKTVSIMVNEEDHLRMQSIFAGYESQKAYDIISKVDSYLAEKLEYAVHPKYGYLTSCLTNAGTGMRTSYMLHLPAIVNAGIAENLFAAAGKLGITVRGMYGEGTKAGGYLFQISNQITMGRSEEEIMTNLSKVAENIIAKERELRTKMHKQKGVVMEDQIMRSLGVLRSARLMQSKELLTLLSNIRLGISLGLITELDSKTLNSLMIETSPAHVTNENITTAMERDIERARIIREKLVKG